jgi:ATP-dependent DNA helicase RecG
VNALIHADYRGDGGVVIDKYRARIVMSNPGTLLVSYEQLLQGGISECRNKSLQVMFRMMGGGDQAGSGIDKIREGWRSQHWRVPAFEETQQPDRVRLILPMESLLPPEAVEELRRRFGSRLDGLDPLEMQTLVTAFVEDRVSNGRLQRVSDKHPSDLTRMLQRLVAGDFLQQEGRKRGCFYRLLAADAADLGRDTGSSRHRDRSSVHKEGDSVHKEGDSSHKEGDSVHTATPVDQSVGSSGDSSTGFAPGADETERLRAIAAPARKSQRLTPEESRTIILKLCLGRYLTASQLGTLMNRSPEGVRARFLHPMARDGLLGLRYPKRANHPDQAYTTALPAQAADTPHE